MDNKKSTDEIKKLLGKKGVINILIFFLVVIFGWLVISSFMGSSSKNEDNNANKSSNTTEVIGDEVGSNQGEYSDYEKQQSEELKSILGKMAGVGEVDVIITFESGEVKEPAVDSSTQTSTTVEDDGEGGTRNTTQETKGDTVVMTNDGTTSTPFITKTYKPKVIGVIIVAEGADDSKIKYDIQVAVSKLYDIGIDKVNVYSMES